MVNLLLTVPPHIPYATSNPQPRRSRLLNYFLKPITSQCLHQTPSPARVPLHSRYGL
jgi:hypothetical protein